VPINPCHNKTACFKKLDIKSGYQYKKIDKTIRDKYHLPSSPSNQYKNIGWNGWEFLK